MPTNSERKDVSGDAVNVDDCNPTSDSRSALKSFRSFGYRFNAILFSSYSVIVFILVSPSYSTFMVLLDLNGLVTFVSGTSVPFLLSLFTTSG